MEVLRACVCFSLESGGEWRSVRGMSARLRAFTLVEVLAVIAILAILMSAAVSGGAWAFKRAYTARAQAELSALAAALEGYKREHGDYPRTSGSASEPRGAQLLQSLLGARGPGGAVLNPHGRVWIELGSFTTRDGLDPLANSAAELIDPWGNAYLYIYKEPLSGWTNPGFVLYSAGADGRHNSTLLSGGYPQRDLDENRDNLYATP